jgi:hypothetical protein
MDYCHWRGKRCQYEPKYWHCVFHRAWTEVDEEQRFQQMATAIEALDLPVGVSVVQTIRRPDGAYAIVLEALPDEEVAVGT